MFALALGAAGCASESSRPVDTSPADTVGDTTVLEDLDTIAHDAPELPIADTSPTDSSDDTRELDTAPDAPPDAMNEVLPDADTAVDGSTEPDTDSPPCTAGELEFVDLPEASGAVPLDADHDLLVADSGHSGRALIIHRPTGTATALTLPLGVGAGDDIEGLSLGPAGRLDPADRAGLADRAAWVWGLNSSGYLRAWRVERAEGVGGGEAEWTATLTHGPVAIGEQGEWVGGPFAVNAAGNFEGLCLHPAPTPETCAGWAASKARGELVCLRAVDGSYRLDPELRLPIFAPEQPSDCAFEPMPPYRLFAAGNVYSGDRLIEVQTDAVPRATGDRLLELTGAPQQEAILVRNLSGALEIQSFGDWQDLAGDRSPRIVFTCRP